MKVLVTGAAGYIGSVLSKKILEKKIKLKIFDNFSFTTEGIDDLSSNPNLQIINGDLRNMDQWAEAVEDVNTVIHLAGISDGRSAKRDPDLTKEINQATFPLLVEKARKAGVSRFILASTFSVYGNEYEIPLTEELKVNPKDPYSLSKAFGENILKENESDDFITSSLRIAMVYGVSPRMRFDFIVNNLVIQALTKSQISIMGGNQRRPQIHIQDITDYLIEFISIEKDLIQGEIFNAGGQNPSILEIAETISSVINDVHIDINPGRAIEDSFELDSLKLKNRLGLKPNYSIRDGIMEIVNGYRAGRWLDTNDKKYYN